MKSVIVEISGRTAVALSKAGDFTRIPNRRYRVGQRVGAPARRPMAVWARVAAVAAAALVLALGAGTAYAACTPYTQVCLDVNPSVELSLNYFDRVVGIQAMNDDARQLLDQLRLWGCDLNTATDRLMNGLQDLGYLNPDRDPRMLLTCYCQDPERAALVLRQTLQLLARQAERRHLQMDIDGESIGQELLLRAREYGVSPGRLMLVERYAQSLPEDTDLDMDQWLTRPVGEIVRATVQNQIQAGIQTQTQTQDRSGETNGAPADHDGQAGYAGDSQHGGAVGGSGDNGAGTGQQKGAHDDAGQQNGNAGADQPNGDDACTATPAQPNGTPGPKGPKNP